jgi:hypothetical protein
MAFTTIVPWINGDTITASRFNAQYGDNLNWFNEQGWVHPTFDGTVFVGNATGTSADWPLTAGMVTNFSYRKRGKSLKVSWVIYGSTIANSPTILRIRIPLGLASVGVYANTFWMAHSGVNDFGVAEVQGPDDHILILRKDGSAFTNQTTSFSCRGQLEFEVSA